MSLINSLKNSVTENLTINQTRLLRNIVEPPFLYSQRSKHLVLVLGCQRSGTTLTYLILNSHPQIKGIDETESNYSFPHQSFLYRHTKNNCLACLKLPNQTFNFKYITQHFPQAKIIWPVRNPYMVISSMRSFIIEGKKKQGNWLDFYVKEELIGLSSFLPDILALDLDNLDKVSLAAHLWNYKNIALEKYQKSGLNTFVFKYEDLLDNPGQVMGKSLNFVGLDWNDIVLHHKKHYSGHTKSYPGGTRGDRPINVSSQKRQPKLSHREIETISSICREQMLVYDYKVRN
jgi:protein-tyrosine sulfotransferase